MLGYWQLSEEEGLQQEIGIDFAVEVEQVVEARLESPLFCGIVEYMFWQGL